MAGYTLNIGINYCYDGDLADCELDGAIGDARALRDLAVECGFQKLGDDGLLLEEEATRQGIFTAIDDLKNVVKPSDFVVITFSGLGMSIDMSSANAPDLRAWLTIDSYIFLAELASRIRESAAGARVLFVSASCYSGPINGAKIKRLRVMSERLFSRLEERLREFDFDTFDAPTLGGLADFADSRDESTTVVHLAACGLDEKISDGSVNTRSPFVTSLIRTRTNNTAQDFDAFMAALIADVNTPHPQLEPKVVPDTAFKQLGPFRLPL